MSGPPRKSPAWLALERGDAGMLLDALDGGKVDLLATNRAGKTMLHEAATRRLTACAEVLLASLRPGASPASLLNARSRAGRSPLHDATGGFVDDPGVAKVLLDAGADPLQFDTSGFTPLHHAAGMGHVRILKVLIGITAVRIRLSTLTCKTASRQTVRQLAFANRQNHAVELIDAIAAEDEAYRRGSRCHAIHMLVMLSRRGFGAAVKSEQPSPCASTKTGPGSAAAELKSFPCDAGLGASKQPACCLAPHAPHAPGASTSGCSAHEPASHRRSCSTPVPFGAHRGPVSHAHRCSCVGGSKHTLVCAPVSTVSPPSASPCTSVADSHAHAPSCSSASSVSCPSSQLPSPAATSSFSGSSTLCCSHVPAGSPLPPTRQDAKVGSPQANPSASSCSSDTVCPVPPLSPSSKANIPSSSNRGSGSGSGSHVGDVDGKHPQAPSGPSDVVSPLPLTD